MGPIRSTYLNLDLSYIVRESADDDLAFTGARSRQRGCSGSRDSLRVLLYAAGWGSDGSLGFRGCATGRARPGEFAAAATTGRLSVLHDVVEGLIELSRHFEFVLCCERCVCGCVVGECFAT